MGEVDRNAVATLDAGDRAQLTVRGSDREIATALVEALRADPELTDGLVPAPSGLEVSGSEFGDVSVVQDFIVAVAAGLTVEGLVATVKAALGRAGAEEESPLQETGLSVTVKTEAPGIVEIEITTFDKPA